MANAKPRDMRAGYDLYVKRNGEIHLEELNARLKQSGFGPVSVRAVDHFGKLLKSGFDRYIPINRFDVARSYRPYENLSLLSRYRFRPTRKEILLLFQRGDEAFRIIGTVTGLGDAGAVINFLEPETITELRKLKIKSTSEMLAQFTQTTEIIPCRVVEIDLDRSPATIEVEFSRLISVSYLEGNLPLSLVFGEFTLVPEPSYVANIDVVGRRIHHFFDLLEGLRAILNEVGRHSAQSIYAPPPVVEEIRMESPTVVLLQLSAELISLLPLSLLGGMYILPKAIEARNSWHEGSLKKAERHLLESQIDMRERERNRQRLEHIRARLREQIRADHPTSTVSERELDNMIEAYGIPPCAAIERTDIQEITVTIKFRGAPDDSGARG